MGVNDNATQFSSLRLTKKVTRKVRQATLTAAQVLTLNTAPVTIVPAPDAGIVLAVQRWLFQFKYGTVQYTGGGAVSLVYHGATASLAAGSVPAGTVLAAANSVTDLGGQAGANGLALTAGVAIDLYAGTANFAAGDGTAVVTVEYDEIVLG
jgi:hypothetical protein